LALFISGEGAAVDIKLFPGVTEVTVPEPEPELEPLDPVFIDLLMRVIELISELKRRVDLPLDMGFEAAELARRIDDFLKSMNQCRKETTS
jgi:hypothetical protein